MNLDHFAHANQSARRAESSGQPVAASLKPAGPSALQSSRAIGEWLDVLNEAISGLENRLGPLLVPNPPSPGDSEKCVTSSCSLLVSEMEGHSRRIQAITAFVRGLTERIEA